MDAREKTKENHSQGHRGCMQRSAKRDCGNSERSELGTPLDLRQVKVWVANGFDGTQVADGGSIPPPSTKKNT